MKTFVLLLALAGCAASAPLPAPAPPQRPIVGATATDIEWLTSANIPSITGNNATIVLFSMTGGRASVNGFYSTTVNRVLVNLRCDQAITLLSQVNRASGGGATWRTMNNSGVGDAVAASTDTYYDYVVLGGNYRLEAVTGGTGPSACEVDIGLFLDRQPAI